MTYWRPGNTSLLTSHNMGISHQVDGPSVSSRNSDIVFNSEMSHILTSPPRQHALSQMVFAAMFPCPLGSPAILNAPSLLTLMALTESNTFLISITSVPGDAAVTPESRQQLPLDGQNGTIARHLFLFLNHPLNGSGWTLSYSPETSDVSGVPLLLC